MSRARPKDNLSAVSLFPFLAVLLCTMGTLLVVLVGVSRSSRDAALREVSAKNASAEAPAVDPAKQIEFQKVAEHLEKLAEARAKITQALRDGQSRLSHIEDHIRRLEQQLAETQVAAEEFEAQSGDQLFDQKQAEREAQRLEQLIVDARASLESLRKEAHSKKRSYSVVPYKGPNGTRRRPLYIECRRNEVVLQPEGLAFGPQDLMPPLGPGNPLAAALRAASEHLAKHATAEERQSGGAYPLLLIRPDGIASSGYAREAIEKAGLEFGYQFVEADWELAYPPPSPELANVEYHAAQQAQARQQLLMAAAPRVYGNQLKDRQSFSEEEFVGSAGGSASPIGGLAAWKGIPAGAGAAQGDANGEGSEDGGGDGKMPGKSESPQGVPRVKPNGMLDQSATVNKDSQTNTDSDAEQDRSPKEMPTEPPPSGVFAAAKPNGNANAGQVAPQANALTPGAVPEDGAAQSGFVAGSGIDGEANFGDEEPAPTKEQRGHDWWYRNRQPAAVPIRRTIQVVVREDRFAILPAGTDVATKNNGGKEIRLQESTEASLDEFANMLRDHVADWGSAGQGLYWRPVLELNVGPDGTQRADDLRRLLKNSGVEVRQSATAQRTPGTSSDATR